MKLFTVLLNLIATTGYLKNPLNHPEPQWFELSAGFAFAYLCMMVLFLILTGVNYLRYSQKGDLHKVLEIKEHMRVGMFFLVISFVLILFSFGRDPLLRVLLKEDFYQLFTIITGILWAITIVILRRMRVF